MIPPLPRALTRNKLVNLRLANQNPDLFLLAKEYDNSLNAENIINIIDVPIKILEDINDKERFYHIRLIRSKNLKLIRLVLISL